MDKVLHCYAWDRSQPTRIPSKMSKFPERRLVSLKANTSAQCYEQFTAAKCRNVIKHFYGRISRQQSHLAAKYARKFTSLPVAYGILRTAYSMVVVPAVAAFITSTPGVLIRRIAFLPGKAFYIPSQLSWLRGEMSSAAAK